MYHYGRSAWDYISQTGSLPYFSGETRKFSLSLVTIYFTSSHLLHISSILHPGRDFLPILNLPFYVFGFLLLLGLGDFPSVPRPSYLPIDLKKMGTSLPRPGLPTRGPRSGVVHREFDSEVYEWLESKTPVRLGTHTSPSRSARRGLNVWRWLFWFWGVYWSGCKESAVTWLKITITS